MMGFSPEWEMLYKENTHLSIWPWTDIVSLVHRYCKDVVHKKGRVLELGCGAGANIPFFNSLGMEYYGVEGSEAIVKQLHQRFPNLCKQIYQCDFSYSLPLLEPFDLVIDRASVTHQDSNAIIHSLDNALAILKSGGFYIGTDWFSTNHSDFKRGEIGADAYTRKNYKQGQFTGVGNVHFSDEDHLRALFSKFEILFLEEKINRRAIPADNHQFASWNLVARRPNV